jgi:hypothetical protein
MKRANAEGAFEDFCANEILIALVALRLRDVAYPSEVELPRFPAKAILSGQALADWRTERADTYVVTRPQIAGGYPWHQNVVTVSGTSD